jgi:hypothetical protein
VHVACCDCSQPVLAHSVIAGLSGLQPQLSEQRTPMRCILAAITMLVMSPVVGAAQSQQFDLDVPPTTVVATIQIIVTPPRGAVLLYTGPTYDRAVRFSGPSSTRVVPIASRTVRIELVEGARSFKIKILGRIDGLDGSKIKTPLR